MFMFVASYLNKLTPTETPPCGFVLEVECQLPSLLYEEVGSLTDKHTRLRKSKDVPY